MRRSLLPTLILLVLLAVGTALAIERPTPACGPNSALAVNPLAVAFGDLRVEAYGRSGVVFSPGETLCVAFTWSATLAQPPGDRLELRLTSSDGSTAALLNEDLAISAPGGGTLHALRMPRTPDTYTLRLTLYAGETPLAEELSITTVRVAR